MSIKPYNFSASLPPWHEVEMQISKEIEWLQSRIEMFRNKDPHVLSENICTNCTLRNLAIMIVTGIVGAKEIIKKPPLKSFWIHPSSKTSERDLPPVHHGGEWHRTTMAAIERHFLHSGYEVEREPNLFWGKADLGIYKDKETPLYVEVGTTSFNKLFLNLKQMENIVYLIVPNDSLLIEFKRAKS